ncbi:MAG TPA: TIGR01777 family oxidoreductase [Myxococcales bacterium]|nr:TIGR01777 family oxidoreductase [Myxococcales bacterium]
MKVVIGGANGLIGSALVRALRARGDQPLALVRRPAEGGEMRWDGRTVPPGVLDDADAAVNLSGANIGARRWTDAFKKEIAESRVQSTRAFVDAIRGARRKPRVFVNASAVGVYGGRGDEEMTEASSPGKDFLAEVCKASEAEAARAEEFGVRTVLLRTGIVLAREGGALKQMLPPFKAFVGGPIGSGKQWFPWIHMADELALILWALDGAVRGPLNAVAPAPVRMKDFARSLARALRRPAFFSVPPIVLRIGLGEMAEVLLEGQRAVPKKALESGFQFRFGELEPALRDLVGARA